MSDDLPLLVAPVLGLLAVGGYYLARAFGTPEARAMRALRAVPRSTIAEFPEGGARRIVGVIEAHEGKTLSAPLSGRPCVAYAVVVEEHPRGRNSMVQTIIEDHDAVPFVVADDTGRALIRAAGSCPTPAMNTVSSTGLFEAASPDFEAYLAAHGHSSQGLLFRKHLRCGEGVLEVGARVAVLGIGRREAGRLIIECLDDGRLLMSNAGSTLR
jgi:hypothetical protein